MLHYTTVLLQTHGIIISHYLHTRRSVYKGLHNGS